MPAPESAPDGHNAVAPCLLATQPGAWQTCTHRAVHRPAPHTYYHHPCDTNDPARPPASQPATLSETLNPPKTRKNGLN